MRILLDRAGLQQLVLVGAQQYQDLRHYYVVRNRLAIVVARNGISLSAEMVNRVVDATMGWDDGWAGFVREQNVGKRHSKLTIYRLVDQGPYDQTLSQFIQDSCLDANQRNL